MGEFGGHICSVPDITGGRANGEMAFRGLAAGPRPVIKGPSMSEEEKVLANEAAQYARSNSEKLLADFMHPDTYPSVSKPVSFFMSGSPGAGKTEYSTRLVADFESRLSSKIARIDPDLVRGWLPQYRPGHGDQPGNAHLFQNAISIGVDTLLSDAHKNKRHFVLDGTMSHLEHARTNLKRSLSANRSIIIFFIYKEPQQAWDFTKAREQLEGRNIPKDRFVDQVFRARENVNTLINEFGKELELWLVEGDIMAPELTTRRIHDSLDGHLKITYTREELMTSLV